MKKNNATKDKATDKPAADKPAADKPAADKPAADKAASKGKRSAVQQSAPGAVFMDDDGRPLPGMRPDDVRDKDKPGTAVAFQAACRAAIIGLRHAVSRIEEASKAVDENGLAKVSNVRIWSTLPNLASYAWSNGESIMREVSRFGADREKAAKKAARLAAAEAALTAKLDAINAKRQAARKKPFTIDDIRDMFA